MSSKHLAVFAASMQWADAVKVVSRGNPKVSDVGNLVKDRKKAGRFPTVRHEHLLGLIGRSHFPTRAQAEEREERRWLDWDRGNICK